MKLKQQKIGSAVSWEDFDQLIIFVVFAVAFFAIVRYWL